MSRRTHSGTKSSPYALAEPLVCRDVNVADLLRRRIAELDAEGDSTDDEFGNDDGDELGGALDDGDAPHDGKSRAASNGQTLGVIKPSTAGFSSTRLDDSPAALACSPTSLYPPSRRAQHVGCSRSSSHRPKALQNPGKYSSPVRRSQRLRDVQDALAITSKLVSLKPVKKRDAPVSVPYNVAIDAPVDASAFTVRREPPPGPRTWRLADYVAHGYRHIRWIPEEDRWVEGTCIPLVDVEGRMLGLLGGKPSEEEGENSWMEVVHGIPALIESAKRGMRFPKKMCIHRRGRFPCPAAGIGYGGGEKRPVNRAMTAPVRRFMDQILSSPLVRRLSGWVNGMFQAHNPTMYNSYAENLNAILKNDKSLRRNFTNSVFALLTVNVGRRTITQPHRDRANRPPGWCPISAFGDYDPTQGGQLVLDEFKLIIDFPSGTTIYIPSALVTHSNTDISPGESRYSITQYTPGALFRWVYNGFRTQEAFFHAKSTTKADMARFRKDQSTRWMDSLQYFPKIL